MPESAQPPRQPTLNPRHSAVPKNACSWLPLLTGVRACLYENLIASYAATTSTLSRKTTTLYSRVKVNCSNCKGRGRQACPSLYGPAPGARLPSNPTPQVTTPPRLARHQDGYRTSCAANASGSSAYHFTHISQGGLANDQPEWTHRRPHTPQRSTHKAPPTRALPEAINTPPGRRCSLRGNQHLFSHNITESRLILPVIVHLRKVDGLTLHNRSLSFLHHLVV